ncbi:MAG: aldo/keto reductase [Candidatus Aminicenantes bacterium]|nr:aldo/keto reductase [Candidatus Aminicenantes bacterium]MCK5004455.1 aldo/keto reductase [Candidatus Aminicenantes bacterium]
MNKKGIFNRRNFIKTSAIGIAGLGIPGKGSLLNGETEEATSSFPRIKKYNTLGRTGFKASDIGLGTSRAFDVPILNALLDAGINYIDTAESYGRGSSERNIAKAIEGRDRKSLFITTKLHLKEDSSAEEIEKRFEKCRARLSTDYIDCLMLHGASSIAVLKNEGFHNAVKKLKSERKLRFTGVSNHGARHGRAEDVMEEVLMGAVNDGRFDLLLIVYNFLKRDPGEKIMAAAKKKNIGITIMKSNPVARYYDLKERIEKLKEEGKEVNQRTLIYFNSMKESAVKTEEFAKKNNLRNSDEIRNSALQFVLDNENVNVLNIAFRNFDDIEKMISLSGKSLTGNEQNKLDLYTESAGNLYCRHACGICEQSCPENIPVNTILRYNHYFDANGSEKYAMEKYAKLNTTKPDACNNCSGYCEASCPHNLPVKGLLQLADRNLKLV